MNSQDSTTDEAGILAALLSRRPAALLVQAGLSLTATECAPPRYSIGKPKSTAGHSLEFHEEWIASCEEHNNWGGIYFDAPVLTLYESNSTWFIEHLVVFVGGATPQNPIENPGSFRESFRSLADASNFVLQFYFRDRVLFDSLTSDLC